MSKKVRKLRAMTGREFCDRQDENCTNCPFDNKIYCALRRDNLPVKLPNGKYILVEVENGQ